MDINVFADFTSIISIIYYLNMSCIIVYLNNMDLQFTCDHLITVIKFMIDSSNIGKMSMNWEGYSLNKDDNVNKTGDVLSMNNPQGGNQQGGSRDVREGSEQIYNGPSRYIGGEPMDIDELVTEDRKRLHIYIVKVRDGEDGLTRLNKTRTPNMNHVLDEIEKKSGPEISYGISKQLCKFMWSCEGRFDGKISSNGRVAWYRIGAGHDSEIMRLLRKDS